VRRRTQKFRSNNLLLKAKSYKMDRLLKIKRSVAGYLSPAKRRRTVGPATPSNNAAEEHAFIPNSDPQDKQSYLSFFARLSQKYLSPSDTKQYNGRKRRRDDDDDDDDDDGNSHELGGLNLAEDEQTAEEKVLDYIDRQEVFAQRRVAVEDARDGPDFEDEEVDLFDRLAMRSFEPLIPAQWHRDFPTLPPVLFAQDRDEEFINSSNPFSIRGKFLQDQHLYSLLTDSSSNKSPAVSPWSWYSCQGAG
jgi:hypothetical protein